GEGESLESEALSFFILSLQKSFYFSLYSSIAFSFSFLPFLPFAARYSSNRSYANYLIVR
ncbi:hypothetical protein, partial [Porphyromonas gingivalis]|uniref:hypothetical protein n=1 Tax=Porphyromonas gingivalis TaxID=837 RepID=UPI001C4E1861